MAKGRGQSKGQEREEAAPLMLQAEVARMLGVTREAVRQWTLLGQLPIYEQTYGGRALFHIADVKKLRERREARR